MLKKMKNSYNLLGAGLLAYDPGSITPTTPSASTGFSLKTLVQNGLNIILWGIGVVALLALVYGGFMYMTAGGDAEKTTKARNIVMYAILGILVVAMAGFIISWASTGSLFNFFQGSGATGTL